LHDNRSTVTDNHKQEIIFATLHQDQNGDKKLRMLQLKVRVLTASVKWNMRIHIVLENLGIRFGKFHIQAKVS